jgi:hypothetical protein
MPGSQLLSQKEQKNYTFLVLEYMEHDLAGLMDDKKL